MPPAPETRLNQYQWAFILLIFLLSLIVRLGYGISAEHDEPLRADALKYALIGIHLVESGSYSYEDSGETSKLITPGYPFIVAVFASMFDDFSNAYLAIIGFQILLSSFVSVLSYLIALRFLNNIAAGIVAFGVAISPHLIISSSYFLTETTHSFFVIFAIYLLILAVEKRALTIAIIAGLVFGYSALIRPAVLLFPLPLLAIFWWKYRYTINLKLSLCFVVAAYLLWMPWQLWEAESKDSNVRQVLALGAYPNMIHNTALYRGFPYREDPEFELMQNDWGQTREILMRRFAERPFTYLQWYLIGKPVMLWSAYAIQGQGGPFIYPIISSVYNTNPIYSLSLRIMMPLHKILFLLAVIAVALEVFRFGFRKEPSNYIVVTLVLFVLYHSGVHMVLAPLPRFSFPYYPILYMLAAYAATTIITEIKRRNKDA